ncbi:hypothetical protein QP64_00105, partial [Staphylococcus aureus]
PHAEADRLEARPVLVGAAEARVPGARIRSLGHHPRVPVAVVYAHRACLHAVCARVADQLGGRVEAHGLRIEQRRAEHVGMMALHPARGIGDLGEAGGVALGEAVIAEAFDLRDQPFGEILADAALEHAGDQLGTEFADVAARLERRHCTTQP